MGKAKDAKRWENESKAIWQHGKMATWKHDNMKISWSQTLKEGGHNGCIESCTEYQNF